MWHPQGCSSCFAGTLSISELKLHAASSPSKLHFLASCWDAVMTKPPPASSLLLTQAGRAGAQACSPTAAAADPEPWPEVAQHRGASTTH